NSNSYSNNTLANGDVVTVEMTSSLSCAGSAAVTSNAMQMTVNPSLAPLVSISANPGNTICSGANVIFNATPTNGGLTPTYQWKLNGNNVGTKSDTYSSNNLVNGDQVSVVMTSSLGCADPLTVASNVIAISITSGGI